jgi:hypothetical protein
MFLGYITMRSKAMMLDSDSLNQDAPVGLILTDAALLAIDSDDAPTLTLTTAARDALEEERKQACADVLLAELKRYPALQLVFAECFKQAYEAYDQYEAAVGLRNVQDASITFSQACEALFFQLKGSFDLATRETSL